MTTQPTPLQLPNVGDTINGKYRILDRVGKGGYGVVYHALHDEMGREVAIKMMRPSIHADAAHIERFQREVLYTSQLKHPNTITLYDCGKSETGLLYVVMEFLKGQDLETYLGNHPPFRHDDALEILIQILNSLAEAHAQGILHRDLKPENIFLLHDDTSTSPTIKVLDFGLSKAIRGPKPSRTITQQGQVFGTPHYMSPEQTCALKLTPASDIYAMGLIAWEMLTGETAFDGPNPIDIMLKQVNQPLPDLPSPLQGTLLAAFIKRASLKRPEDRFQNAFEALQWLERLRSIKEASAPAIPTPSQLIESAPNTDHTWQHFRTPGKLDEDELHMRLAQLPMIGRKADLERLLSWGNQALMTGGVLWVVGEMGIGKSRLVEEWARHMEMRAVNRMSGQFTYQQDPLEGLRQAFANLFDPDTLLFQEREAIFSSEQLEQLQAILRPTEDPGPSGQHINLLGAFGLLERTLYSLARHRPTLFILEDLHCADEMVLQFVEHLQDRIASLALPLLVVLTTQPASSPKLDALYHTAPHNPLSQPLSFFFTLELAKLSEIDSQSILDELLPFEPELRNRMVEAARGNPLYLCEIVAHLFKTGQIAYHESQQRWVESQPQEDGSLLPPQLELIILERIFHHINQHPLKGILLALLDRIAILGTRIELRLLRALLKLEFRVDLEQHLDDALESLHHSDAVLSTVFERRPNLLFSHDILRTQLLDDLEEKPEATALHRLAAHTKESHFGNRDEALLNLHADEIAMHWELAGQPSDAFTWLMRAATAARMTQNFAKALDLSKRAKGYLERYDIDPDGEHLLKIQLLQGEIHRGLGQFDQAEASLREALEETRRVGDDVGEAMTGELLAEVLMWTMKYEESTLLYKEMRERYTTFGLGEGVLRCELGLARLKRFRGEYEHAAATFEELGARALELGETHAYVHALHGQAQCAYARGNLEDSLELYRRARKQAEVLGEAGLYSEIDLDIAIALISYGHVEQAITAAQTTLELKRTLGDQLGEANSYLILGLALRRTYRISKARHCAQRARVLFERVNHPYGLAKTTLLEAEIAVDTAHHSKGLALLDESWEQHTEIRDQHGLTLTLMRQINLSFVFGHTDRAEELIKEMERLVDESGLLLHVPYLRLQQGVLLERQGNLHGARNHFLEGVGLARQQHHMEAEGVLMLSLTQCTAMLGEVDQTIVYASESLEIAEQTGQADHLMLALSLQVIAARLARAPDLMASTIRRLRVLHESQGEYDVQIPKRVAYFANAVNKHLPKKEAFPMLLAAMELCRAIGAKEQANQIAEVMR